VPFVDDAAKAAEDLRKVVALSTVEGAQGGLRPGSDGLIDQRGYLLGYAFFAVLFLFQICWMGAVLFSPLRQLTRRLSFVVVGVITLASLSEISTLNLHQYLQPPMGSGNSVQPVKINKGGEEPERKLDDRRDTKEYPSGFIAR